MITKGIKEICAEAESEIETMDVDKVMSVRNDPNVQLVDVRDRGELAKNGAIPGALHASRGMLEFVVDPQSPYHNDIFASDKKFILFCAGGLRSALAAQSIHRMGLNKVAHMAGGFGAWVKAGGETEAMNVE